MILKEDFYYPPADSYRKLHIYLPDDYAEHAIRGYEGVIRSLTWEGEDLQIGNVCIGTGVGDYAFYIARPVSVNDLHAVGSFLIMCTEMYRWQKSRG